MRKLEKEGEGISYGYTLFGKGRSGGRSAESGIDISEDKIFIKDVGIHENRL
ncbi:hypothetical protein [Treponema pedis]|uniref:hypothetical protein n=1 Tax=Treponema pedis TaxID=409322 RepID=UPI000415ECDB|nr:hypothetical protein [Treponema pedis]